MVSSKREIPIPTSIIKCIACRSPFKCDKYSHLVHHSSYSEILAAKKFHDHKKFVLNAKSSVRVKLYRKNRIYLARESNLIGQQYLASCYSKRAQNEAMAANRPRLFVKT